MPSEPKRAKRTAGAQTSLPEHEDGLEDRLTLGARLSGLRHEHRFSIRQLAERAGISASLISDVERGKVEPSISTLKRLSDALGTTLTYFFSEPTTSTGRVVRAGERA